MRRIFLLLLAMGLLFFQGLGLPYTLLDNNIGILSMDAYLRNDVIKLKNVFSLDSHNKDDSSTYLGIDYHLGFKYEYKNNGPQFYLQFERNGPGDYAAPLWTYNQLTTTGGKIDEYRKDELLPRVEEFWLDTALPYKLRARAGLYTYEVGNSLSLNGAYKNYGFTLYQESENLLCRIYYCRPDLMYKTRLGPRVHQDKDQGYLYHTNAANFFATDIKLTKAENYLWPYLGVLADYTSFGKRDNRFSAPIKRDILATFGSAFYLKHKNLSLAFEAAHNFGQAISGDPEYKDIQHTGYMIYTDVDYKIGKIIPSLEFLLASGNKVTPEAAQEGAGYLTSGKNRAFSVYSPTNLNLGYTIGHNHSHIRPVVAMGCGAGLNYGVPRPKSLADSDFDNIIIIALAADFNATKKFSLGLYGYQLMSFKKGVATLNSEGKYLSRNLGRELDLFLDYQLNKNTLFSFLAGYFLPGKFYKEERDDTSGSVLTPFVRGDGSANCAYQLEFSVEFQF